MWTGEISAKLNLSCRYAVCASSPKLLVPKPDSLEALTLTTYCRYPRQVRTLHSSRICLLAASSLLYSQAYSIFSGQLHQRATISDQHELTFYSTRLYLCLYYASCATPLAQIFTHHSYSSKCQTSVLCAHRP